MNNKTVKALITIIALLLGLGYYYFSNKINKGNKDAPSVERFQGQLQFTEHARCRMACRGITEAEVRDVLFNGQPNLSKSDKNDKPCPSYAFEGHVPDGQHLRIIVGNCGKGQPLKVITCIDLEQEHDCDCR